jgi:hypothetical protein
MLSIASNSFAQKKKKKERFPSYFGIVASPVIPNNFIGSVHTVFKNSTEQMTVDFHNKWGFTFGATARIGIAKFFSLETGISQVRRMYNVNVSVPDSSVNVSTKLAFINYDIPLNGLFYIKLSENWLMDASLGVSLTHFPSNVQDTVIIEPKYSIAMQGWRTASTYFAINAGVGFEYRTHKAGTFFLGLGVKVPGKDPLFGRALMKTVGTGTTFEAYKPLKAGYFTIDFKYFIPTIKLNKNKEQPNPSLIE